MPEAEDVSYIRERLQVLRNEARKARKQLAGYLREQEKVAVNAVRLGKVSMSSTLDNARLHEALFYLETYSKPEMAVPFYLKHGFLELGLNHMLKHKLPASVFVENVLARSLKENSLDELEQVLSLVDPTLVKWTDYLVAACRYLQSQKRPRVLYQLQVFMKVMPLPALPRAALTHALVGSSSRWPLQGRDCVVSRFGLRRPSGRVANC
jgi:hypothetical protein